MTGSPLVTIAVPTFNRATMLERCLESALGQSYAAVEVIVCDNASTDSTEDVVTRALAGHPRARYVRHDTNLGAVANFQAGLDLATGDYFMWLADDDWLDPDYVARCVEVLRDDPRVVLANGDAVYYTTGHPPVTDEGVSLTQASATRRVLGYYAWVIRNAAFYGLSTTEARRAVTLDDALACDWVHVAELAALGTIRRVPATIHRLNAGASTTVEMSLAGVTQPIAKLVAADVRRAVAFSHLSAAERSALAFACAGIVYWRYGVLHLRDRLVGRLTHKLKSRLSVEDYQRLRRAYHRLARHHAPSTDRATLPGCPRDDRGASGEIGNPG